MDPEDPADNPKDPAVTDPENPNTDKDPDATDKDPDAIRDVHFEMAQAQNYEVFSLNGQFLGKVLAMPQDMKKATANLVKDAGVYIVKSANGLMKKVSVK